MTSSAKDNHDAVDVEDPNVAGDAATKNGEAPPSLGRLFQTVKPEKPMLLVGLLLLLAAESSTQVIPLIVAKAYDSMIDFDLDSSEKMSDINYYMLISIIIFVAGIFAGFLRECIFAVAAERMVARLRNIGSFGPRVRGGGTTRVASSIGQAAPSGSGPKTGSRS